MKNLSKIVSVILTVAMLVMCLPISYQTVSAADSSSVKEIIYSQGFDSVSDVDGLGSEWVFGYNNKTTNWDNVTYKYFGAEFTADTTAKAEFEILSEGTNKYLSTVDNVKALAGVKLVLDKQNYYSGNGSQDGGDKVYALKFKYKVPEYIANSKIILTSQNTMSTTSMVNSPIVHMDSADNGVYIKPRTKNGTTAGMETFVSADTWADVRVEFAVQAYNQWYNTTFYRLFVDDVAVNEEMETNSTSAGSATYWLNAFVFAAETLNSQFCIDDVQFCELNYLTGSEAPVPTVAPTTAPTAAPTQAPTVAPTSAPTSAPTNAPTTKPTTKPTAAPTLPPVAANEDNVLWADAFDLGSAIAPSSGSANRWNRIYLGKSAVIADPFDASNGVAQFTAEANTLSVLKGFLPFEEEFVLSSRIMIPTPESGSPAPFTLKVGTATVLTMTYDSAKNMYAWTAGNQSGYYEMNKWIKVDIRITPDSDASTVADSWANCDMQVIISGNIKNSSQTSVDKIIADSTISFVYNADTWGVSSNGVTYDATIKAPAGGKASFLLDDVYFYEPSTLQLTDVTVETYGDIVNNIKLEGKVTLKFNHDLDVSAFNASMISVKDSNGNVKTPNVVFDKSRPDIVILDFSTNKLDEYTTYTVVMDENLSDVLGEKTDPASAKSFKTKGSINATPTPMPISTPPAGGYIMPDKYNTGHITPREELIDIDEKYPEFKTSVNSGNRILTEEIAEKYNYVFEGFSVTSGSIEVVAENVTLRDFYMKTDAYTGIGSNDKNLLVEDAEIEGTQMVTIYGRGITMRRLYLHDVYADHLKPVSDNVIESCYLTDGGSGNHLAHPDGMQFSGQEGYFTNNIKVLGNRIDMPNLPPVYNSNAPLFCSLNFGDSRNVQMSYNWVNGGGYTTYITTSGVFSHTKVTLTNNYFGIGRRYGYYALDPAFDEGERLEGELTMADNIILEEEDVACAGSVVYYDSNRKRIYDLNDLEGNEMTVMVNLANYTTRAQNIKIVAELVKDDSVAAEETLDTSIHRYTPTSEYMAPENIQYVTLPNEQGVPTQYETLINFPDLPRNVEKELTLTNLPSDLAGYRVQITVYSGSNADVLKQIRSDVLYNSVDDDASDVVYGDVNEDSKINSLDRAFISRYIAKWDNYNTINETAADVNMDSRVNALDRAFVSRYIAKWDGYTL